MKQRRLTILERELAEQLLHSGVTATDVAHRFGVSRQAVSRIKQAAGIKADREFKPRSPAQVVVPAKALDWQRALLEGRRDSKLRIADAAYKLGVTPDSLRSWERADHIPNIENLKAALSIYGYDVIICKRGPEVVIPSRPSSLTRPRPVPGS
jgi:transcriptional regulator with XRE-family HTH domain